ncbi:aminodeoxychorismate synthase component I [Psychromarinibacter sp. C21-152]|uniref:Aminodeoxychorismate synthase component I n=1 Tax=Psychromarinibacter sediminicola TaxID=3033385 RepID=A0AAE3TAX3_9RHOB|nr:aminodeoxychorismate synthase component I [Psychromarinibacter sediminicola]MDF0603293.1 aminodeoxychorismate synthase component I [Psychromarinibacter sediminicola]
MTPDISATPSSGPVDGPEILFRDDLAGRELHFSRPREIIRADTPEEVAGALAQVARAQAAGRWCAGYLSYEAGYALEPKLRDHLPAHCRLPLVQMGVFDAPETREVAPPAAGGASLTGFRPAWSFADYAPRFEQVHRHLCAGDCYQANLTFPIAARWQGDPAALFDAMTARQPVRYGALVRLGGPAILSRSPELFFEVDDAGWIETHPMKGTIRRGATPEEDARLAEALRQDPKNRAENLMIVDLLRNDISRICALGTLHVPALFRVEHYPTVHQLVSRIRARLAPGVGFAEIVGALFPCGSITGAPKIRAMQILRALEARPRDIYCGAIGYLAPSGGMRFNVAIRTVTLHEGGEAVLNVGGGLVYDSEARAEYDECLLKAKFAAPVAPSEPLPAENPAGGEALGHDPDVGV